MKDKEVGRDENVRRKGSDYTMKGNWGTPQVMVLAVRNSVRQRVCNRLMCKRQGIVSLGYRDTGLIRPSREQREAGLFYRA